MVRLLQDPAGRRVDGEHRGDAVVLALRCSWSHDGVMPSVQIDDVADETHAVLRRRAALAHRSLQEHLLTRPVEEAGTPTLEEVLERAGGRAGGHLSFAAAVTALHDDRGDR